MKYYRWLFIPMLCFFIEIAMGKTIRIGVEKLEYLPYYQMDIDDEYVGFARELFDAFQEHSKYSLNYNPASIKTLYEKLFAGKIDAKFPDHPEWNKTQRTDKKIFYSKPIVKFTDGVAKLTEFRGTIRNISIVKGFTPWMLLPTISNYRFKEVSNFGTAIKMVLKKEADGVYGNIHVVRHNYEELGYKAFGRKLIISHNIPFKTDYYYLSSLTSEKFINDFDAFLTETAFLKELLSKHNLHL